jgi:DNA modification methylase
MGCRYPRLGGIYVGKCDLHSLEAFFDGGIVLHCGDCIDVMATLPDNWVDSVVCDPPYHLTNIVKRFGSATAAPAKHGTDGAFKRVSAGFMGKAWDGGDIAFQRETWAAVLRVLKPGAHLLAFGGTRTYHRLVCAIEDAGFEVRDCIVWAFGQGFPKSHDVSKGIDKHLGAERERDDYVPNNGNAVYGNGMGGGKTTVRGAPATDLAEQWSGWGTALKPALEPICLARKPLSEGTVAANVLKWGTGALNIDGCRIETDGPTARPPLSTNGHEGWQRPWNEDDAARAACEARREISHDKRDALGRWPANLIHDGSDEVVAAFPAETGNSSGGGMKDLKKSKLFQGDTNPNVTSSCGFGDSGSAARFFYTSKADSDDRAGSQHPTVKPLDLIQYLCRLVCPPGGTVLDPFAGTGTTGEAAWREGMHAILIEREAEYQADIRRRMALVLAGPDERTRESIKARGMVASPGPLFDCIAMSEVGSTP